MVAWSSEMFNIDEHSITYVSIIQMGKIDITVTKGVSSMGDEH